MNMDPNRTVMGGGPPVDLNRTLMGGGPSLQVTQTIVPVQCPVCKSFNPPGLMACNECGLIFAMALDGDAFGAPSVRLPALVDEAGREHPIRPGANLVGRKGDIAIDDNRISRQHARLTATDDGFTIEDLGSTNGTKVDGQPLAVGQVQSVAPGQSIEFGGHVVRIQEPGQAARTLMPSGGRTMAMAAAPMTPGEDTVRAWLVTPNGEIPLREGVQTFGRRDGNDVVVADPYVSGSHGTIDLTPDAVYFTDTGSSNGTSVNGAKLATGQRTRIQDGDEIQIGQLTLRIRYRGA